MTHEHSEPTNSHDSSKIAPKRLVTDPVIRPGHPRWDEFVSRLAGPEACSFVGDRWTCNSEIERPFAGAILTDMGGVDVESTLEFFETQGGFCDCEILFNVDAPSRE